jgi:hypothetical protein
MRLSVASMALSLTLLSTYRHATAFLPKGSHVRTLSKTSFGLNESTGSSKLFATVEDATVESNEATENLFPLLGLDVMDVAPRMRFAPSPTGR